MKLSPAGKIGLGFGLALIPLVAFVSVSFWTARRLGDTARSAERALKAVNAANGLHEKVESARAGVGAYLVTGDTRSLAGLGRDAEAVADAVAALRGLNPADPVLQGRLDSVASVLRREAESRDRIVARRGERELTPSELLGWHEEESRLLWRVHREIDDEIESDERAQLAYGVARARAFASSSILSTGLGGFVGIATVIAAALIAVRDARARGRAEGLLEHQAQHDGLTGLPNRHLLQRHLESNVEANRANGGSFALLLIDLDRFKQINDSLGHHYGDVVLRQMNPRLRAALRGTDVVARLGGDEFAVLLPGASRESAVPVAERILGHVRGPIGVDGHRLEVGASIGIALFPEHGQDAGGLLRQADLAMYTAKRSRGGQAVCVSDRPAGGDGAVEAPRRPIKAVQGRANRLISTGGKPTLEP